MRTAIVIPARLEATRLPNKPLASLGGTPLVVRTFRQACKCRGAGEVVVATDSPAIREALEAHGGRAIMTRRDHPSGTDRVAEAAAQLDADLVVNLQGDEPFINPRDLEAVLAALAERPVDMATLHAPIGDAAAYANPNVVKVVTRDDGLALYFSRASIPHDRDGGHDVSGVFRHIGVYGYRREALERLCRTPVHALERRESLEQLRALATGMTIAVLPALSEGRGIDTEEDLAWARARVAALGEAAFP